MGASVGVGRGLPPPLVGFVCPVHRPVWPCAGLPSSRWGLGCPCPWWSPAACVALVHLGGFGLGAEALVAESVGGDDGAEVVSAPPYGVEVVCFGGVGLSWGECGVEGLAADVACGGPCECPCPVAAVGPVPGPAHLFISFSLFLLSSRWSIVAHTTCCSLGGRHVRSACATRMAWSMRSTVRCGPGLGGADIACLPWWEEWPGRSSSWCTRHAYGLACGRVSRDGDDRETVKSWPGERHGIRLKRAASGRDGARSRRSLAWFRVVAGHAFVLFFTPPSRVGAFAATSATSGYQYHGSAPGPYRSGSFPLRLHDRSVDSDRLLPVTA